MNPTHDFTGQRIDAGRAAQQEPPNSPLVPTVTVRVFRSETNIAHAVSGETCFSSTNAVT